MRRWGTRMHAALYRTTHGRLLGRVGGQPALLLQTVGRRTGRRRTTPVQYLRDDQAFVVVASNAGAALPPLVLQPASRAPRSGRVRQLEP